MRIELLPEVDVQNPQRRRWRLSYELSNGFARAFAALGEAAETDCVRSAGSGEGLGGRGNVIPGNILQNRKMRQAVAGEHDFRYARRRRFIGLEGSVGQAHIPETAYDLAPIVIVSHSCNEANLGAESMCVISEVSWRSAQLRS